MSVSLTLKNKQVKKLVVSAEQAFSTGKFGQAEITCEKILKKDPGNSDAHRILGLLYLSMNRSADALKHLHTGCQMNPDIAVIHAILGDVLIHMGRTHDAAGVLYRAVIINPENIFYKTSFVNCMRDFRFDRPHQGIKDALVVCLQGIDTDIVCQELMKSCRSLMEVDPAYGYLRELMQIDNYEDFVQAVDIKSLEKPLSDKMLLLLMERVIVTDPEIEKLYTRLRRYILNHESIRTKTFLPFLNALACQCYYNEYIFSLTEEESNLKTILEHTLDGSSYSVYDISLLGCYKALHRVTNIEKLVASIETSKYPGLDELFQSQIAEPLEEKAIINTIPSLGSISNKISEAVREQYDENPYPRWNNVGIFNLTPDLTKRSKDKDILIAGTGTGREAASAARCFPKAKILAVDLSLRSLAYGARKIRKMGITNIDFMQADILELGGLDKQFDLIASSGVLHFMDEPEKALKVLAGLIKPTGLLKIGVYSKIARRKYAVYHQYIRDNGYDSTMEGMRAFRADIMKGNKNSRVPSDLLGHFDFYSTSMCRDMIFHVHEHVYNLMDIKAMLERTNLYLLGMEMDAPSVKASYTQMFPDDEERRNLDYLHEFEMRNPDTFIGMYNLWLCRENAVDARDIDWISIATGGRIGDSTPLI